MATSDISDLMAGLFLSREVAHREHLKTESYAAHMALGTFYEGIIGLADGLAEAYQGRTEERIKDIPYLAGSKQPVLVVLKKILAQVEVSRKQVLPDDPAFQNLIDGVVDLFLSTIYKLTFLK